MIDIDTSGRSERMVCPSRGQSSAPSVMEAGKDTYAIGTPLNKSSMHSTVLARADGSPCKMLQKQKKSALQVMPSEDLYVFSGSLEKKVDLC